MRDDAVLGRALPLDRGLAFFPWRLQWGLSVFQWGSNPHNPPPIFTMLAVFDAGISVERHSTSVRLLMSSCTCH